MTWVVMLTLSLCLLTQPSLAAMGCGGGGMGGGGCGGGGMGGGGSGTVTDPPAGAGF